MRDSLYVIQVVGRSDGEPTEFDGKFVSRYDPDYHRPEGYDGGILECTPDVARALHFASAAEALEKWRQPVSCRCHARRLDGKPNRPLTAFHCAIMTLAEARAGKPLSTETETV